MKDNVYRIEHLNKSFENTNGEQIQVFDDLRLFLDRVDVEKVHCSVYLPGLNVMSQEISQKRKAEVLCFKVLHFSHG